MAGAEALALSEVDVAILGWAGSSERQLHGVGGFYRRRRAASITLATADVFQAMARPDGWAREGEALARRLEATDAPHLFIHAFSNAGFWMHAAALRAMDPSCRARIVGVVLDSAPGFPERIDPWFYARYSTMAMTPMVLGALKRRPALHHPIVTPPLWAFLRLWYHASPKQRAAAEESLGFVRDTGGWDHLLLYSAADELVPPHFVESFAHRLREAGRGVRTRRWEDGGHVRQMLGHRQAYFGEVADFVSARVPPVAGGAADPEGAG